MNWQEIIKAQITLPRKNKDGWVVQIDLNTFKYKNLPFNLVNPSSKEVLAYKDVKLLEKFVSDRGKIRSSLITGITKQEQAKVARLVKVARELALLPYVTTSTYKQSYNRR